MLIPLSILTTFSNEFETDIVFSSCQVLVEGIKLLTNLVLLDVIYFNVILGMDWLAQHYATLDYREKEVIFRIPNDIEFQFRGDKSLIPRNLISTITVRKTLRKG